MGNFVRVLLSVLFFSPFFFSQSISWQQLSGPHGGSIYSIVHDNDGNIYANTIGGPGPFKSTDDGESWFSIKGDLTPYNGEFHPMNINSSGDLFIGGAHSTAYLCRSTDGGNSWEPLNNLNTNQGSVVCISFDSYDNVYVGTGTGIYKSTDNGDIWNQYGTITGGVEAVVFNDSGHVFAGTSYAVYRSKDDGANWTQLPTGGGTRTVAVAPNGYIFAGCWEGGGILRSTDNGDNWTFVYPQMVSVRSASSILFDTNGDIYFPTWGNGVLKSTDNGDNWIEMNNNLGRKIVRVVTKNNSGNFFVGCDYAIYKSVDNCASWYSVGLPICGVNHIVINSNHDIFAGVYGVNRSTDGGQTWQTINNGLVNLDISALAVKDNGYLFAGTNDSQDGTVFRSTDNGENWTRVDSFASGNSMRGLAAGPNDEIVAVGGGYGYITHISYDDGLTWNDISYNLLQVFPDFRGANGITINSTGDMFIIINAEVWRKLANDTVWTVCSGSSCGIYNVLFIASNGYIYTEYTKSTDNGDTWTTNNNPTFITSYAENSLGHLFIGTSNWGQGVYRSTDYAETWEQINDGLPIMDIHSVGVDDQDYLYAGSWGMSMFKTTTSTILSVDDIKFAPTIFSLEQNYPNPFNPSTKIKFTIPSVIASEAKQSQFITLKVYDVLGNEVATLVNEYKPAGSYEVEFNTSNIYRHPSSGIYFYQLKAGEYTNTKKMSLVK
jgi:photosystem II stability/assembly factor-like uncharacterized protein